MTKSEKLFALYNKRARAIKENLLNNPLKRKELIDSFRTIVVPDELKDQPASPEVISDIQQASQKMWNKFAELDAPRAEIQAQIDLLIKCYNPIAVAIDIGDNGWSVFVEDKKEKFSAWVDVWIDEDSKDVITEWNNTTFYTRDEDDIYQMLHQEADWVWECFTSVAIDALLDKDYIGQNEYGEWFVR